ncbi:MAG: MATE family efflux transporter [candidate division Zixibacteria bacterium]|nr:MATE family efflux transporter [candidate division Zixibacteria bacterium]
MKPTTYTEGSILNAVWRLAWPAVTSMFFETFLSITDAFWVGKLGASEMAAVTSSMFPIWTIFSLLTIIPVGVVAIISRAVGAGAVEDVNRTARQSLIFAVLAAVIFSIAGYFMTPLLFRIMHTDAYVTRMGIGYMRIFFVGIIFFFLNDTLSGIFRAAGDTKAHLIASSTAVAVNIVLDPLLIFGIGPFPRWGVAGASVATDIAAVCATAVFVTMILRGRLKYPLGFRRHDRLDFKLAGTIVKIGFPTAISGTTFSIVYIFINRIVAEFGTKSIAALMIGHRMESLSYLTSTGFYMAASTLVGQNLGAAKTRRAEKSAWTAVGIAVAVTTFAAAMFLLFPHALAAFFINDPEVIAIAVEYLRIIALSQMFMAVEIVLEGAFAGAGNTIPPMAISLPGSIARLPLAYYLCFTLSMGITGVWWALTITTWAKAIAAIIWFRRGEWKKTGLIAN